SRWSRIPDRYGRGTRSLRQAARRPAAASRHHARAAARPPPGSRAPDPAAAPQRRCRAPGRSMMDRVNQLFARSSLRMGKRRRTIAITVAVGFSAALAVVAAVNGQDRGEIPHMPFIPNGAVFLNPNGASQTYSTIGGGIDQTGPFFQSLGTNGRSCSSCHQPSDGMSVSAAHVQRRFVLTYGLDPIFRPVDGSNCNHDIDVSTIAGRSAAYSLLRTRGLIRIAIAVPANADFDVISVDNPYGCGETDVIS